MLIVLCRSDDGTCPESLPKPGNSSRIAPCVGRNCRARGGSVEGWQSEERGVKRGRHLSFLPQWLAHKRRGIVDAQTNLERPYEICDLPGAVRGLGLAAPVPIHG